MVWLVFLAFLFFSQVNAQVDYVTDCIPIYDSIALQNSLAKEAQKAQIYLACSQASQLDALSTGTSFNALQLILFAIETVAFFVAAMFGFSVFR